MGLVVLVFVLLVVMPGLLYLVGFGVNRYIQKRVSGVSLPASPKAHRENQVNIPSAKDGA